MEDFKKLLDQLSEEFANAKGSEGNKSIHNSILNALKSMNESAANVNEMRRDASRLVRTIKLIDAWPRRTKAYEIADLLVQATISQLQQIRSEILTQYNSDDMSIFPDLNREDMFDYEAKKSNAKYINETLRQLGRCIADPTTKAPSSIFAVGSRDGYGRYVLEDRFTKKRNGSFKSIEFVAPFKMIEIPPYKESMAERRRKKLERRKEREK